MATNFLQKAIASADAFTGLVSAANGAVQRVAIDSLGRAWNRVFGDTPHDSPDNTNPSANYPVKIGGRAAPSNAGFAAPVAVDDRTDAAFDTAGRQIVNVGAGSLTPSGVQQVEGNAANDAVDSGNPVKTGGVAVSSATAGQTPAVAAGDRVNQAMDLNGRALTVSSGDVANDAVDAGNPVKVGGIAVATPNVGLASAVAALDRVQAAFDTRGRQVVLASGDTASGTTDGGNPLKMGGVAVTNGGVLAAVSNGQRANQAMTQNGMAQVVSTPNPIADGTTSVWSVTNPVVGNATGQLAIKSSAGRLRRVLATNNDAAVRYLQVFNVATVGGMATANLRWGPIPIPAGGTAEIDFGDSPLACTVGICVGLSTTQTTYTAVAVTGFYSAQFA